MASWRMCPDCDGQGRVACWLCDGEAVDDVGDACRECIDGSEPCETCDAEGGWYDA